MLHILSSSLHHEELEVPFALSDQWKQSHQAIAVLTGGTESLFLEMVENGKIPKWRYENYLKFMEETKYESKRFNTIK